jgi:hypothetical protein
VVRSAVEVRQGIDARGDELWLDASAREIVGRADRLQFALETLKVGTLQRYRLRYLLAKLTQYVDENAWGTSANTQLDGYLINKIHIEHILPDSSTPELKAQFDLPNDYSDYSQRLGNLTLLEMSINTSIQQDFFSYKTEEYKKSHFLLTQTIGEPFKVGTNTQPNRATARLRSWQRWNSEAIKARQRMLVELAWDVWEIGAPLGQPQPDSAAATSASVESER